MGLIKKGNVLQRCNDDVGIFVTYLRYGTYCWNRRLTKRRQINTF